MLAYKPVAMGMSTTLARAMSGDAVSISAAGTDQNSATHADAAKVFVNGGTGGVRLSINSNAGDDQFIYNGTSATIKVYPPVGDTINNLAVNVGVNLASHTGCMFHALTTVQWGALLSA